MNILVKTFGNRFLVRPDTTWVRNNEDFYPPEEISSISFTPVLYARFSRAGRCIGQRFADRYYDAAGYGILLYPDDMLDGSPESFASASCINHTSFLPSDMFDKTVLKGKANLLEIKSDGRTLFKAPGLAPSAIEDAISGGTRFIFARRGDLLAIEMASPAKICTSTGAHIQATLDGAPIMDFRIIM